MVWPPPPNFVYSFAHEIVFKVHEKEYKKYLTVFGDEIAREFEYTCNTIVMWFLKFEIHVRLFFSYWENFFLKYMYILDAKFRHNDL